jgi:hypothetical protein
MSFEDVLFIVTPPSLRSFQVFTCSRLLCRAIRSKQYRRQRPGCVLPLA